MVQLQRSGTKPLLRTVAGKPHASSEDHEEDFAPVYRSVLDMTEEDINADPISSGDEGETTIAPSHAHAQSQSQSQSQSDNRGRESPVFGTEMRSAKSDDMNKSKRMTTAKRKRIQLRVPNMGKFERGQRVKESVTQSQEEKENEVVDITRTNNGEDASDVGTIAVGKEKGPWGFGDEREARKYRSAPRPINIHAGAPVTVKRPVPRTKTYGSSAARGHESKPTVRRKTPGVYSKRITVPLTVEGEEDEDEDLDCELKPIVLPEVKPKIEKKRRLNASSGTSSDIDLDIDIDTLTPILVETKKQRAEREEREATARTEREQMSRKALEARARLEALAQDQENTSSQKSNSASQSKRQKRTASGTSTPTSDPSADPHATLNNLEQYLKELPTDRPEADNQCPSCHSPVPPETYWEFWRHHRRQTIRNQTLFCREHKRREALEVYESRGYPEIDWDCLPQRIKRLRDRLIDVLRGDIHSDFRSEHEEKVKAGAVRTMNSLYKPRTHLKPTIENLSQIEEDEAQVDEELELYTGYYGARGAQAMTAIITSQLAREIRKRMEVDRVVAGQGMAVFVQRVLVPECARELVMEDMGVGEKDAGRIVKRSGEVGRCVWEEVEDRVRGEDEEDMEDGEQGV